MEIFAGLSVGLLMLGSLFIATKTFVLWRRSRELPELLLSLMLLLATVIGYPLAIACTRISAIEMLPLHIAYPLAINGGFTCLLLFTLTVFRAKAFWAVCFTGLTMLVLTSSAALYIFEVTRANPRGPSEMIGLSLFNSSGIGVVYFWTTFEALSYYRRLKLQMRLGLAEAVVANRVLLWGLMTLAAGVAVVVNAGSMMTGTFMSAPMVFLSSVLGLVHASCLFLAFHPPDWYRNWVEQGSVAQASRA